MSWIDINVQLPPENKYVIVKVPHMPWRDFDDPTGVFHDVAKMRKGISMQERSALKDEDERKITWYGEDEGFNNERSYYFTTFGPTMYFGQDVTHWAHLPNEY